MLRHLLLGLACCAFVALLPSVATAQEPLTPDEDEPAERGWLSPSPSPAEAPTPKPQEKAIARGLAGGGASTSTLFGVRSTGLHLDAGAGIETHRLFIPFQLNAELGRTPAGLGAGEVTASVALQAILGRVRLGGGVDAGYGWITRASTSTGAHIGMYALDAFALATVDLFSIGDRRAVYLGVKPSIGVRWGESFFAWGHGTSTWRGAAMVGMRF